MILQTWPNFPENQIYPNTDILRYQSFGNFTDIKRISQGFSEDDAVWVRERYFALKIYASIAANAFCRLHNDKYEKF